MARIEGAVVESPIGRLAVFAHDGVLVLLEFEGRDLDPRALLLRRFPDAVFADVPRPAFVEPLLRYFDGELHALDAVACDPGGFVAREVRPLGSGNLRSMVHANGLAIVPEGQAVAEASDSVAVMLLGPPDAEGEDEATVVMRFAGKGQAPDPIVNIHLSFNNRPGIVFTRHFIGTKGSMRLDDETDLTVNGTKVIAGPQKPSNFTLQTREFVDAIRSGRETSVPGWQGRRVVQILEAAHRSAATHAAVDLTASP